MYYQQPLSNYRLASLSCCLDKKKKILRSVAKDVSTFTLNELNTVSAVVLSDFKSNIYIYAASPYIY